MPKTRFNTYDTVCMVTELQKKCIGLRLNNVFDINNKTYLFRLQEKEQKVVLLMESGLRFHTTNFEWTKNMTPSGFTMKLRKHLKNKRLEQITQLGIDRIVDFQFGTNEAAYHVILELYDRGNIVFCDHEYTILQILRFHTDGDKVKFAIREKYPLHLARKDTGPPGADTVREALKNVKGEENLRSVLNPILEYGPSLIDHVLMKQNLYGCVVKGSDEDESGTGKKKRRGKNKDVHVSVREFDLDNDFTNVMNAICDAETILRNGMNQVSKGYLVQKIETKPAVDGGEEEKYYTNIEYQPLLYLQYQNQPVKELETFDLAVDEFYSTMEGQKIDLKAFQHEKEALKKLSNVKEDHAKRLEDLANAQREDVEKADLISHNKDLVDKAILAIRTALAHQFSWQAIHDDLLKTAQLNNDPVAMAIKQLKLEINHITMELSDPYEEDSKPMLIDIDLSLSAFANARKYYDMKRYAAKKEQKTVESSVKALKNAERKTQTALKEIRTFTKIAKARKTYWFEKFFWFISSENYLVIGGRDAQQNELIVKRYMRPTDYYVHAEIQGASSVVIKNPNPAAEVPPKTLLEAGTMSISYSVAWDAKVATNCYWVKGEQVSKTAPSGEYLATGSFMIRGKRNALPPCHLVLGLSILFKLEDASVERHKNDRKIRGGEDDASSVITISERDIGEDQEINLESDGEEEHESGNEDQDKQEREAEEYDPENKLKSNSSDEEENESAFPDTQIQIKHTRLNSTNSDATDVSELVKDIRLSESHSTTMDTDENLIIAAAPTRIKQIPKKKQKQQQQQKKGQPNQQQQPLKGSKGKGDDDEVEKSGKGGQLKRGQKSKLKKIKEKYKDQDEEERELRMQILQSAGNKKNEPEPREEDEIEKPKGPKKFNTKLKPVDEDLMDDTPVNADIDMIDTLTGCPVEEDELLFAIPVVAPYQALQNYKFKVKLTPGTGKRGKAAKTALDVFLKDKSCSQHEKDLLKAMKDETLARNIPGKVKLSAPQLQKVKK